MIAAVPMELTDAALASDVVDGLALVEEGLRAAAQAENDVLAEASAHLMQAGGKRFRPTLVLLAAQFGDPKDPRIVPAAVAVELTHLATLYHDDVMDEAAVLFIRDFIPNKTLPSFEPSRDAPEFEPIPLRATGLTIYHLGSQAAPASILAHWAYTHV